MKAMRRAVAVAMLAMAAGPVWSADVSVQAPWVRATVTGQKATGAFMALTSAGGARLVGAASPAAGVVEIHSMSMEDGVMRMRAVKALELPPGKAVTLGPGGYHIMLMDLRRPLVKGDAVPLTLSVEDRDGKPSQIEVSAEVRELTAGGQHGMSKH